MLKNKFSFPPARESILTISILAVLIIATAIFVGLRLEHILIILLFLSLFFASEQSRKLAVGLIPFALFGISYDWMRIYPNYLVNPIDTAHLYNLEKYLFGIHSDGKILIACEYFATHNNAIADFFSGIFYLGWVPIPIGFAFYLYLKNERKIFLQFSLVFLFTNLIGFMLYYIHPAAPPWYVMSYGFEAILDTPGNMAGLVRFDELIGIPVFGSMYGRNSNVFAAVPSLHSAYLVVVLYYAIKRRSGFWVLSTVTIFLVGIWFTAVYTAHHYIIDVILGIVCALVGIVIFEFVLLKTTYFKRFFNAYYSYVS